MQDRTALMNSTANQNFLGALAAVADAHAQRPCLSQPGAEEWSFAMLSDAARRVAGALAQAGVGPGDRGLAQVDQSAHAVALYLATLRLGAVYVPINTAYTSEEVAYFRGDSDPRVLVCREQDVPALAPVAGEADLLSLGADGGGSLLQNAAQAAPVDTIMERAADDIAAIVYTSGTTGRSKGAMLTHDNLASNARVLLDYWGWVDDDVLLHALPVFHVHGLFVALHCALLSGTPMIFLPQFDASAVIDALPQATVMMGVPTFYTRLLERDDFTQQTCAGVRVFISGSAPLTEQTFAAWEARTGHRILERYGMSETMMNTSNPLDGERVPGTVGYPLPGVEARVVDAEGRELSRGEVGVIEVRGANVFAGYWRMPDKTAEEFRDDGFFITGDLGKMEQDGRVSIVGRAKDLVISGGYNIYPKEVERLIDEMPEVLESAVIGVPHRDFGEGVVAVVVPVDEAVEEPQVRAVLEGRLARFKHPKVVVNVPDLPRNAMGKVQKKELRDRYERLFSEV